MSTYSELADVLERVAAAAVSAGRAAGSVDPVECDRLLDTILAADRKLSTACAYLRQRARPGSISGFGESHDRMNESLDRMQIASDMRRDDDDDFSADVETARSSSVLAWDEFVEGHPELAESGPAVAPRIELDDDAIVAAVAEAGRQLRSSAPRSSGYATSPTAVSMRIPLLMC
jgi:hypothetical protein